jgi:hypothetical protein
MSLFNEPKIRVADSGAVDAFGKFRVSQPLTLFDSKCLYDAAPLFWDDVEASGGGTASAHSVDTASVSLSVSNTTAGKRIRQTRQRFNYQPGKSQNIIMTAVMGAAGTGLIKRLGALDANNGLFFENNATGFAVGRRTHVSGSAVDTLVYQTNWNKDKLDGTGPSGITLDLTKTQIFVIDFQWLGVGRVRYGFEIDGKLYICHEMLHANSLTDVYMSTPNLPLRGEIENTGTGAASTLKMICGCVISEGGAEEVGLTFGVITATHVDANTAGTMYACLGVQLKSTHLSNPVRPVSVSLLSETADRFYWQLMLNPTVADVFTYGDITNTPIQAAYGATVNTVTNGTILACGLAAQQVNVDIPLRIPFALGSSIAGVSDTLVLCVVPLSANLDVRGALNLREGN